MMTRKHFKALADALHLAKPEENSFSAHNKWKECINQIADTCAESNPRFDYQKFFEWYDNGGK